MLPTICLISLLFGAVWVLDRCIIFVMTRFL